MTRRIVTAAAVLGLCGAMAILAQPAGASSAQKAALKSKALSISNMPSGWSVDNSSTGGASNFTGCLGTLEAQENARNEKGIVRAQVKYDQGSTPALQETLIAGGQAAKHYSAFLAILNNCKVVGFNANGVNVTGSAGAMSFPTVGNASSAYAFTFTAQGVNVGLDLVVFKVGSIAGDVAYEDLGSPDASTVQAFVTEAVDKIEGKPVTVPPDAF